MKYDIDQLTMFEKQAVELLTDKFLECRRIHYMTESLEHSFEVWSKRVITSKSLTGYVWRRILQRLMERTV